MIDYKDFLTLCEACVNGDIKKIREILKVDSNWTMKDREDNIVNGVDHYGMMPLEYALIHKYDKIASLLIDKGASIAGFIKGKSFGCVANWK